MQNRKALLVLGLALGVPILFALSVDSASGIGPEVRAYDARLARAKALGFDPGFRARLARDAAKPADARRAFDELEAMLKHPGVFRLADPKHPVAKGEKEPTDAEIRTRLKRAAELARAAEGGSHRQWDRGLELLFPEFAQIKGGATAADTLARRAAAQGDYVGATDAILDAADLWRAYGDDPILITDLVRSGSLGILFRTSGRLLADPNYPPAQAERLFRMADGPDFAPTVAQRDILIGETVSAYDVLDSPGKFGDLMSFDNIGDTDRTLSYGAKLSRVRRAWQSDALRLFNDAAVVMPSDPYDFNAAQKVWRTLEDEAARPRGLKGKFSEMIFPVFSQWVEAARLREARRRVLRMAAGLRAGRTESSLGASRMAIDPGDDRPLRVRAGATAPNWLRDGKADSRESGPSLPVAKPLTAVYAVGRDGNDDGGKAVEKNSGPGDEVLVIPTPKRSGS